MHMVDADEFNETLQDTVGFVPAQPGTYLVDYVDGKMRKEAPIVGWKICDSGSTAKPISPVWAWWLEEKRCLRILFPDGSVDDINAEQTWNSVAEFEKEMAAETKARTKEAVDEPA